MAHLPRFFLVWLSTVLLAACAGAPPPDTRPWSVQTAERLEHSLTPDRVALAPQQAAEDLERALRHYALADNQEGQLRCHLKLARLYLQLGAAENARPHVADALRIAARLDDPSPRFQSALLEARLSNRRADYEAALDAAVTPIEVATVLTYLGRTDEAYRAIRPHLEQAGEAAADYAFVLHHYARQSRDMEAARLTLELYKQSDNPAGTAGALYLMGRIAQEKQAPAWARGYLERALAVSRALEDNDSVRRIETALEGL